MTRALCFSFHSEINHLIGYCSAEAQQLSGIKAQQVKGMNASETTQSTNSGIFESIKTFMSQTWGWEEKVNTWFSTTTITLAFYANFFSNSPYVGT